VEKIKNRSLKRHRDDWDDNTQMDPRKIGCKSRTDKWRRTGHQTFVSYPGSYATTKITTGATKSHPDQASDL
jgi:hypothetical protein